MSENKAVVNEKLTIERRLDAAMAALDAHMRHLALCSGRKGNESRLEIRAARDEAVRLTKIAWS